MQRVSGDNSEKFESVEKEKEGAGAEGHARLKESLIYKSLFFFRAT